MPLLKLPEGHVVTGRALLLVDVINLGFKSFRDYNPCVWVGLLFFDRKGDPWPRVYSARSKSFMILMAHYFGASPDTKKANPGDMISAIRNSLTTGARPTLAITFSKMDIVAVGDYTGAPIDYAEDMSWPERSVLNNCLLRDFNSEHSGVLKIKREELCKKTKPTSEQVK